MNEVYISSLKQGSEAIVVDIIGDDQFISRISSIGFTPETLVTMIQNNGRGPILVYLRDSQIALGRTMADKITVRVIDCNV
jgi:ferrous iron transport protein A